MNKSHLLPNILLFITISVFLSACNGLLGLPTPTIEVSNTPIITETGVIYGWVIDKDRNPLIHVENGDLGIMALLCTTDNESLECLDEKERDIDINYLIPMICDPVFENTCLLHWEKSAAKINNDGTYVISKVLPGEYDLLLIMVSSGMGVTIQIINVDRVEANKFVRYDFITK